MDERRTDVASSLDTIDPEHVMPDPNRLSNLHTQAEVESAFSSVAETEVKPGWKTRVDELTATGVEQVAAMRTRMRDLVPAVKERVGSLRSRTSTRAAETGAHMRNHVSMWAGVAAGAGLGIGLLGRILMHRSKHRMTPQLVIIETSC